jgi:hypothetical protein
MLTSTEDCDKKKHFGGRVKEITHVRIQGGARKPQDLLEEISIFLKSSLHSIC